MPSESATPPVLIIGMHRSGTSMLAELLKGEGLFLGHRLQEGHTEARFFQELDEYVLAEASCTWDRPEGLDALFTNDAACDYLVDYLNISVGGPRCAAFLGPRQWVRTRSLSAMDRPWGWKDPRTTLLLPLWRRVFPDLKVLHVTRHGIDVARSLQVRTTGGIEEYTGRYHSTRSRYRYMPRQRVFTASLRVADLDQGVELWDHYTTVAHEAVTQLGDRALEFRYEDLVGDPDAVMPGIVSFCGLSPRSTSWSGRLDAGRVLAHREDADLAAAAERHAPVLARHGY